MLIYDKKAFETVGYFDVNCFASNIYGYAHHLWSLSVSESNIQLKGIHDVIGSNKYIKVHNEQSCTPSDERIESYRKNREIFQEEMRKLRNKERNVYTSK